MLLSSNKLLTGDYGMSKTSPISSSKLLSSKQKNKKGKAQPITITVPEKLRKSINKYKSIKISAICQKALQEAVNEERAKKLDRNEVSSGVERLMKQMGEHPRTSVSDYTDECYEAGKTWAASEATIEELISAFEGERNTFPVQIAFGNYTNIPSSILDQDKKNNELLFCFLDGADEMWHEMRKILVGKGYEF